MMTYFIRCGTSEWIKIGRGKTSEDRKANCQTGCPYKLNIIYEEKGDKEKYYQDMFAEYKGIGEWYRDAGLLAAFLTKRIGKTLKERQDACKAFEWEIQRGQEETAGISKLWKEVENITEHLHGIYSLLGSSDWLRNGKIKEMVDTLESLNKRFVVFKENEQMITGTTRWVNRETYWGSRNRREGMTRKPI